MDEIVEAALRKWPNVPHCHGWLALDARGNWYLRDDASRAAGPFPQVKGSRIDNARLRAFIERNYACDAHGGWYFQNGPQRVYVDLEAAPWVWRLHEDAAGTVPRLVSHTVRAATLRSVWSDDEGRLFLDTDIGFGLVHSLDMALAADAVVSGDWVPVMMPFADMAARFGHRLLPRPD